MDKKKFLEWLDRFIAESIKSELWAEGQKNVRARDFYDAERNTLLKIQRRVENGDFDGEDSET